MQALNADLCFMNTKYDIVIAGGGIVGLATAYQVQQQRPDLKIAVLEKESAVAKHQSSRNSGVIHSGIYYKPGSLKALNCKKGYQMLMDFCRQHGIPFEICGKIIVAVTPEEVVHLDRILQRGIENGLDGIRKISRSEALEIEPHVQAEAGVWVPQTGIVDYGTVARKYAELIVNHGNTIITGVAVTGLKETSNRVVVVTSGQVSEVEAGVFVNCAGLYSDRIARMSGQAHDLQIIPFRGEYYDLVPARQHLVRNLIYPVPNPDFPFLGVHFTRMIEGGIESGPNAVLAFRREGYSRWDLNGAELAETLAFPGFRKIAGKYWRDGWAEMQRSYSKRHFLKALQRLVPDIRSADIVPGRAGVRAMACDRAGNLIDDFLILEKPRIVNVCNAPSPAATASLAIGETIAKKILLRC